MKMNDAVIAWTPPSFASVSPATAGEVDVRAWGSDREWTRDYAMTGGCVYTTVRRMEPDSKDATIEALMMFNALVVSYGMNPEAVHEAFMKIDEYSNLLAFE